jgi:hypothetical protein
VRILVSAFLSLVLVAGGTAAGSWHVRVNESIAGVRLGMTRAQVAAQMGKPYAMTIPIRHVTCGMYARNENFGACFDTRTHRVVSVHGIGPSFCVVRPLFCFQRVGGVAKLKREFGRRLIGPVWNRGRDELFYEVIRRRGGRRVQSAFAVDTQSPPPYRGSAVIAAYISFCGRQAANVPRCPSHG